jgi:GrpB-like predicted nucleotidyltransferase (UPF0157 family)
MFMKLSNTAGMLETHSPHWSVEFADLRAIYLGELGALAIEVEHVGSTAVPGLLAKPILDIDVVISGYDVFADVVSVLSRIGYSHNGDQGIPQREAFKPLDDCVPHTTPRRAWMKHHLYVCPAQSPELRRHLRFRDALRASPELCVRYERIKRDLAARSHGDRKRYAQLKEAECGGFFAEILEAPCNA